MTPAFRAILEGEYLRRSTKNPRYSKRAFASDLGIAKSSLLDMLSGRRGLSPKSIEKVSQRLGLSDEDIRHFCESTSHDRINEIEFSNICHWWHFAILALAEMPEAEGTTKWVASQLEIEEKVARKALKALCELQLIEIKGTKIKRLTRSLAAGSGNPSRALKVFHSENLNRAEEALFSVPIQEREMTSITAPISHKQYLEIVKETQKFRKKVLEITDRKESSQRVYTCAVQVFPQSKRSERYE